MKTIMIIGAGKAQLPLIEAAKRENYHTVVCDIDPNAPGVSLADEFLPVSTKDRAGLLHAAKSRQIDGLVANSEYAMCDAAFIADQLGLVGNPESAVAVLSSKNRFRALQKRAGLFAPASLPDESVKLLLIDENPLSFPVIIKPDQSSGSRCVAIVTDPGNHDAIRKAILAARATSRNGKAIAEEQVPMPTRSIIEGEIFLHHGEILWDGLFHTVRSQQAPMIPMTYVFPLQEDINRTHLLKEALTSAFRSSGIVHGEYNIEMFFTASDEPFLIELNPRQGGNDLPRYVQQSCGLDLTRLLVTTAVGDDTYWDRLRSRQRESRLLIHHMLYPHRSGHFQGLRIDDSVSNYVCHVQLDPFVGDRIEKAADGSCDIGYVDLCFSNYVEQMHTAMQIEDLIQIRIEQEA